MINIDDRLIKEVSPKIRPNALSVLLAIAIHLNQKTNRCFPSHERLMALTGMGKNAVYDALNVLKEEKLLVSEQPIDSKSKKFGRRTFRLTTRFIKIFVDAQDAEPLPESREPESREPESREPESRETYQINEVEQINHFEQINKEEVRATTAENPFSLNSENNRVEGLVPPPAPLPAGRVDVAAEVERLKADHTARENFTLTRKIPADRFERYVADFSREVSSTTETYWKVADFRRHFFNWCEKHYRIEQDRTPATQQQKPALPRDMVNLNAL